jgi:hypothetical protein
MLFPAKQVLQSVSVRATIYVAVHQLRQPGVQTCLSIGCRSDQSSPHCVTKTRAT